MRALLLLAAAALPALTFTDPAPVAETSVAAPPAVVALDGRIHLLWLDRPPGSPRASGEVWHAGVAGDGRIVIAPRRIETGADTRFAWPVAAAAGSRIHLAWMARGPAGVALRVTVLEATGDVIGRVSPAAGAAEEGGRIALLVTGAGSGAEEQVHLAWSQFDRGARRVWYARLDDAARVMIPGRVLAEGEAPALARDDEGLRLLWWTAAGGGTYTLRTAALQPPEPALGHAEDLTGPLLLADPLPPIASVGGERLDILVPTLERSFRTSGQLYLIRLRGGSAAARLPLSRGRPLGDVAAWSGEGTPLLVWAEPAGRRQNGEIFAARLDASTGQLSELSRVSYTPSGSLRPSVTGPFPTAAWLETVEVGRFRLVVGTAGGRRRMAILNAPELDAARPASAAAFAAAAILSVLPFAALFSAVFGLAALALGVLAAAVLGGFAFWDALRRPGPLRLGAFLGTVLVLEVLARRWLPGAPGAALIAASILLPGAAAIVAVRKARGGMTSLVAAAIALAIQMTIVLFPWGVGQLSQL